MTQKCRLRICLAASAGGHLTQLLEISRAWAGHDVSYIVTTEVVKDKLGRDADVHVVGECNREHPIRVIRTLFRCLRAVRRQKPDVVISTGAAAGCMTCLLGKLFAAKVVWVDSITNVNKLSLSGRMVRHVADLLLVQWPELADKYARAHYVGSVI